MTILGLSLITWTVIAVSLLIIAAAWYIGAKSTRKAANAFYSTVFLDLRTILSEKARFAQEDIETVMNALESQKHDAVLPASLLRVEYALERVTSAKVNRILAVAYMDAEGKPMLSKIEREYDWDFIPDELASETIRAGRENVNIEIYTKK